MASSGKSLDDRLRRLAAAKQLPVDAAREEVKTALAHKSGFVAAKAADLARELKMPDLVLDLAAAFETHMIDPARTDKGCLAKLAIVRALHELDYDRSEVFEKGVAHVQLEGVWGAKDGSEDTAISLRAASAIALAGQRNPRVLELLIPAMMDKSATVRSAAMRAVAAAGREEGMLLLRMKSLAGDGDEEVMTECFSSLLNLGQKRLIDFVGGFLEGRDPIRRTAAALALGGCRLGEAFDLLRRQFDSGVDPEFREVLLLAIASMRDPRAMDFLVGIVREGALAQASEVIRILKASRVDDRSRERIETAVKERGDERLVKVLGELA